ncbi:hypothetical protein J6590_105129, partial [Homalodisca vitripennis]
DTTKSDGLKVPLGKGRRLIICHVGSAKDGFLQECKWVFRSKTSSCSDYAECIRTSVVEQIIINLADNSDTSSSEAESENEEDSEVLATILPPESE